MGHLAAAKAHGYLHPVAISEELQGVFQLHVEIPDVDTGRHADLLDLHHVLVLAGLLLTLALLEPVLSVVHQLAHGGIGLGGDLDQVQPLLVGDAQGLLRGHDTHLFAAGANKPQFLVADLLIQLMHYTANTEAPPSTICTENTHRKTKARMPPGTRNDTTRPAFPRARGTMLTPSLRWG